MIDFIWGYFRERSVPAGVITAVGGLFGTAWYLLLGRWMTQLLKWGSQDNDKPSSSQQKNKFIFSNKQASRANRGRVPRDGYSKTRFTWSCRLLSDTRLVVFRCWI